MNASTLVAHIARRWMVALGLLAAITLMAPAARAGGLPDGWKVYRANGGAILTPVKLNPGEKFEVWVDGNTWYDTSYERSLQTRMLQARRRSGAMEGDNCQPPKLESGLTVQTCVAGDAVLQYMLLPMGTSGSFAQLLRIRAAGAGVLERYHDGFQQTLKIVKDNQVWNILRRQEQQESERIARAIRTAPGKGVRDSDIAAVFVTSREAQNSGETVYRTVHTSWLLLKDGTGYNNTIPPDELNVEVSRQLEPQRWVQWRKPWLSDDYEIRGPKDKDWHRLKGWLAQPARPDERLNGVYERTDYWGSMFATLGHNRYAWMFSGDGAFKISVNGSSGYLDTGNHINVTTSRTSNSTGTRTSTGMSDGGALHRTSGGTAVALNNESRKDDGARYRGRYRLNGWVLELERDDGQTERLFVTFRDGQRSMIDLNSNWFEAKKK